MNGFLPPVSDEELHGLVDGETAPARREAILDFLSASPADAVRVETWRRQNETIRAVFEHVETEQVPLAWPLAPPAKRSGFPCKLLAGREAPTGIGAIEASSHSAFWRRHGHACLFVAGLTSGMIATIGALFVVARINAQNPAPVVEASRAPPPAETDAAFINRATSALQAFTPPPAPAPARTAAPHWDKSAVAQGQTSLILPNLFGTGLKLAGVRVAPGEFDQMFCLFYAKAADAAVALCVEKAEDPGASGFRKAGRFPSSAITWRQRGAKYALSGALTETELRNLAERAHAEVDAFDVR